MFAVTASSPGAAATTTTTTGSATTPSETPRPSRLRGLTYLRQYTQNLSHQQHQQQQQASDQSGSERNRLIRSTSYQSTQDDRNTIPLPSSSWTANSPITQSQAPLTPRGGGNNTRVTESSTTPAPAPSRSGMTRMRRAFSSQTSNVTTPTTADMNSIAAGLSSIGLTADVTTTPRTAEPANLTGLPVDQMPTIKFIPFQDPRANRPSLAFAPTSRTLPHADCVIRVGRYSERDIAVNPPPGLPSAAPVGFKSKVVSRRHCEFWCSQGQWYIKDVKSSSGTFLNHIRLSQPSQESRPFPVNDGDVVQLGIDFRGGEEAIFRCVKIKVECNRAWQKSINPFNVSTHKRLRDLNKAASKDADAAMSQSTECAICLLSIAPCQSLFVAPCSHVWHFKCIRPMLNDHKAYPQFICPNCRSVTDLEADVEEVEDWDDGFNSDDQQVESPTKVLITGTEGTPSASQPVANGVAAIVEQQTAAALNTEGPLTPRNDAGPFVFDGGAGRAGGQRLFADMANLSVRSGRADE